MAVEIGSVGFESLLGRVDDLPDLLVFDGDGKLVLDEFSPLGDVRNLLDGQRGNTREVVLVDYLADNFQEIVSWENISKDVLGHKAFVGGWEDNLRVVLNRAELEIEWLSGGLLRSFSIWGQRESCLDWTERLSSGAKVLHKDKFVSLGQRLQRCGLDDELWPVLASIYTLEVNKDGFHLNFDQMRKERALLYLLLKLYPETASDESIIRGLYGQQILYRSEIDFYSGALRRYASSLRRGVGEELGFEISRERGFGYALSFE